MVDIDHEHEDDLPAEQEPAAQEEAASSLVKLVRAMGGGRKQSSVTAPAPARQAAPVNGDPGAKKPPPPMPSGALVTIVTRNEFYRDGFRNMLRVAVVQALIIVALLVTFIIYIGTADSKDRYFATTADGRIMQLVPLDQPNMTEAALMSWVTQASSEVMTFGFHDFQRRLQQSARHFTHRGWETFTGALQRSHIIESMQSSKQVLTAAARSAPTLVEKGVSNGKYRWIVKLPLAVTYNGAGGIRNDSLNVTLVIERVPSLENPNGVGIEQWIATQG